MNQAEEARRQAAKKKAEEEKRKKRKQLEARLDQLGKEWGTVREDPREDARRLHVQSDIFSIIYKLYPGPRYKRAISLIFTGKEKKDGTFSKSDWDRFDPEKGLLSHYISSIMEERVEDSKREDSMTKEYTKKKKKKPEQEQEQEKKQEQGQEEEEEKKEEKVYITPTSINTGGFGPNGERDGGPLEISDTRPGFTPGVPSERDKFDETSMKLLTIMMKFMQELKDNSDTRYADCINYFRLFYTGVIVDILHPLDKKGNVIDAPDIYVDKEREAFEVMKHRFLDFVLTEICRTLLAIQQAEIQNYDQMVEGKNKPHRRPKKIFPADVYYTYLTKIENHPSGASAVSNHWKAYRKILIKAGIRPPSTKNYTADKLSDGCFFDGCF